MRGRAMCRAAIVLLPFGLGGLLAACSYDPGKLFDRDDPQVELARGALEASVTEGGDADLQGARMALEEVLRFRCESDGGRDLVIDRPGAALDLGLVMFRAAELIGRRFGDEELVDGAVAEADELVMAARAKELDCVQLLLRRVASDPATPPNLALRARYLLGNFAFLARKYKDAIARYDEALLQHPARGIDPQGKASPAPEDDDAVARYAAWNRAIALRRLEDQQNDAGPDGGDSASPDGGDSASEAGDGASDGAPEGSPEAAADASDGSNGSDSKDGGGEGGAGDSGGESGNEDGGTSDTSTGADGGKDAAAPSPSTSTPAAPTSTVPIDLRELDRFDQKTPLDPDFKKKMKERKKIPKGLDK